jgi:hypothetical protein
MKMAIGSREEQKKRRLQLREFARRAVLLLFGVLFALICLELLLRLRFGSPLSLDEPRLDLSEAGFRYGSYTLENDPMVLRIVGIGDSFAYGVVKPQCNYHNIAEKELARQQRRPVEVINLGRPGIGPAGELTILQELGFRFSPDVVSWTFFTGNDYTDDQPGDSYRLEELLDRPPWEVTIHRSDGIGFLRQFRVAGYLYFLITYVRDVGIPSIEGGDFDRLPQESYLRVQKQRLAFLLNHSQVRQAFRCSVKPRLEEAVELCQERNTPLLLVVAPDRAEVELSTAADLLNILESEGSLSASELSEFRSSLRQGHPLPTGVGTQLLHQFHALEGVSVLDLTGPFRERAGGLYFEGDSHWNCDGNELAGRLIANKINTILQDREHSRQ